MYYLEFHDATFEPCTPFGMCVGNTGDEVLLLFVSFFALWDERREYGGYEDI